MQVSHVEVTWDVWFPRRWARVYSANAVYPTLRVKQEIEWVKAIFQAKNPAFWKLHAVLEIPTPNKSSLVQFFNGSKSLQSGTLFVQKLSCKLLFLTVCLTLEKPGESLQQTAITTAAAYFATVVIRLHSWRYSICIGRHEKEAITK